jgi:hypothetical protein
VPVPLNLVILQLVVTHLLFHAMTMMHVLMTTATHTLDVLILQLIAMITTLVPMITVMQALDATMNAMNANIKMLAIP